MAGKEVSIPLIKLQEQITCGKCFNVFTKPKTLSCHHSFCQECIEGLATIPTFSVACPTCHQHTELSDYAGPAGFSVSPHLIELKKIYDEAMDPSLNVKCGNCPNLVASGYCKDCNLTMCQHCINTHKSWSPFTSHVIVELDDPSHDKEAVSHVKIILSVANRREAEIREQGEAVKEEIRSLLKSTIEDKFIEEIDEIVARKLQLLEKQKEESLNASDKIEEFHPIEKADIHFIKSKNDIISCHVGRIVSSAGLKEYKVKQITAIKHIPEDQAISFELSIESPDDERSLLVLPVSSLSLNVVVTPTITKPCPVINAKVASTDKPGVYRVICTPVIRGRYQVNVRALGIQLKLSSSFTIPFNPYDVGPIRVVYDVDHPRDVAIKDNGHIIVSESSLNAVSILSKEGMKLMSFGTFSFNHGVAVSEDGSILVADTNNHGIQKISMDGEYVTSVGSSGTEAYQFQCPTGIAVSPIKNRIYVIDRNNRRVQVFNNDLTFCRKFGKSGTGDGEFNHPVDIAIDKEGYVYVTDCSNHRIQKFTHDGKYLSQFGGQGSGPAQLMSPAGVTVDTAGLVYVSEYGNHRVSVFTSDGVFIRSFGEKGQNEDQFNGPNFGMAFKHGFLYICDTGNNRLVVY